MPRDEIAYLFARRLDAWNRHDAEGLARDHAEEGTLNSPMGGDMRGRANIENFYRALFSSFPDAAFEQPDLIIDGDRVVQVATMTGTNSGGSMSLPPTGKRFSLTVVLIITLRDGQIVSQTAVYDFTRFLIEIGVLKAKPV
jgi:steroid delta-isomerase-like uncharacterized protein